MGSPSSASPPSSAPPQAAIPSLDRVLASAEGSALIAAFGRQAVTWTLRAVLDDVRTALAGQGAHALPQASQEAILARARGRLESRSVPPLRRVFNLTGTVLHTNLGRALLAEEAIEEMAAVARGASNLEYDLDTGRRGQRDTHLEALLCELTGAEAATAVNNNAAAVLLLLNTLAQRKEVPVSRGELIEIGGSFRIPDIMKRAGARLVEVGTTNRTHKKDFADAIGPRTALLMKVHTSNYVVEGFTASVREQDMAGLAHEHGLPFVVDLGSGTLVDFRRFGLPHEQTPAETLAAGADLVTFSGDKLLGGPQAGLIAGRADLIAKINSNPMKRAMRLDKVTIAALAATLRLYDDPDRLAQRLPTLRLLTRPVEDIAALAARVGPAVARALEGVADVSQGDCLSQLGSGSLPVERLASKAILIRPHGAKRASGPVLDRLAAILRALPVPVIGRIHDGALLLDMRCLEDEAGFTAQLSSLDPGAP